MSNIGGLFLYSEKCRVWINVYGEDVALCPRWVVPCPGWEPDPNTEAENPVSCVFYDVALFL